MDSMTGYGSRQTSGFRSLRIAAVVSVTVFFSVMMIAMIVATDYFLKNQDQWETLRSSSAQLWITISLIAVGLTTVSLLIIKLFVKIYNRVRDSSLAFKALVEQTSEAIVVASCPNNTIIFANKAFSDLSEYAIDELTGASLTAIDFLPRSQVEAAITAACADGKTYSSEFSTRSKSGRQVMLLLDASPIIVRNRTLVSLILHDISQRRQAEEALQHSILHDPLTGLPNRQLFSDRLKMALAQARRTGGCVGVIYLDLDNFKDICETFGHKAGDLLLNQVAERVQGLLREGDTVARQGGDEFMILLSWVSNPAGAAQVAERLVASFKDPFVVNNEDVHTSASIGISMYPADGQNGDELLKRADIAMYQAKSDGRNSFALFDKVANTTVMNSFHTKRKMSQALKNSEFVLHYQPQIEITTGLVNGVEALIRWNDPERGLVPPNEFIPIAEQTGFISVLSDWVVETACQQGKRWAEAGLPRFRIAVNLSARQFHNTIFVDSISASARNAGLEPGILELEITETTAMKSESNTKKILELFRKQGISITLDDFGTGYSSLSYLRFLPFDTIKIDRSFISELPKSPSDQAIVAGIINLAHRLNIKVVAEGVETAEQFLILKGHECDSVQGFGLCRPQAEHDISNFLKTVKDPIDRLLRP